MTQAYSPQAAASEWQAWQQTCHALGLPVSDVQLERFQRFYEALVTANRTVNLTRITALEEFLYRHLLDSLALSAWIPETPEQPARRIRMADVGSGAGFPSIPLAILRPDLQMVAVESVGKKCQFMQQMQTTLALEHFQVENRRSEELARDPLTRESFDVVTARAVAALPVLLEWCVPLVRPQGRFLAMKGLSYESELQVSQRASQLLGVRLQEVKSFEHPKLTGSRVLVFEKTRSTPDIYPRPAGKPAKNPL